MMITKLVFQVGGYFGGYKTYTFDKVDEDTYSYLLHNSREEMEGFYQIKVPTFISKELFDLEFHIILDIIGVKNWKKDYILGDVCDGEHWEVLIYEDDKLVKEVYGDNKYPTNFEKLRKHFEYLEHHLWDLQKRY